MHEIKCIVWDLDHTLWNAILLEDQDVQLRPQVKEIIETLDRRGIVQSVASKNDHSLAIEQLKKFGLADYFLYPQINWNSKSTSIRTISEKLGLSLDTFAFVDDQAFEGEEVQFSLPDVLYIQADAISTLLAMPEMNPKNITADAAQRRLMYLSNIQREVAEQEFTGTSEAFLATLHMQLTIALAQKEDLARAEELTIRTHQLNTTGYTYSLAELEHFCTSEQHKLFVVRLNDKYGTYGTIGIVLLEITDCIWTIKLFLMSCRVLSRGVGTVMLSYLMQEAKKAGVELYADFVHNGRNRMMYITYKFAGFEEVTSSEKLVLLRNHLQHIQAFPDYIAIQTK